MEINDKLGNLYRAALMIGKGNVAMGRKMLARAGKYADGISEDGNNLIWAEKILDRYMGLRWS